MHWRIVRNIICLTVPDTLHAFIDTQVFDQLQHNYRHNYLQRLVELVQKGYLKLYLTTITRDEMRCHVEEYASTAVAAYNKLGKNASILRNFEHAPFEELFSKLDVTDIRSQLLVKLDEFLQHTQTTVISVDEVSPSRVFDRYFKKQSPFGVNRKRAEFPDAFAALALEQWSDSKGLTMLVVSGDDDWKSLCEEIENLEHVGTLAELLERFSDKDVAEVLLPVIDADHHALTKVVNSAFQDCYFYTEEVEGEVVEVIVDEMTVTASHLIEAADGKAKVHVECEIDFSAEVQFEVPGTGYWDSESGQMFFADEKSGEVNDSLLAEVELDLTYDPKDPKNAKLVDAVVSKPTEIGIDVGELNWE